MIWGTVWRYSKRHLSERHPLRDPVGCRVTPTRVALPLTPRSSRAKTAAVALAPVAGAAAQHLRKAAQTQEQARWCAHLSELLRQKGCEVHGIKRRSSLLSTDRIDHFQ